MNHDEKFQQRWEFGRGEVDEDSLSDEATGKRHEMVTDLVLLENDEGNDTSRCQRSNNLVMYDSADKKIEPSKKKNLVLKKSNKKRNSITKEMVMLVDLKGFADSLIRELTVARESMFAHMTDEMTKLVSSRPNLEPLKKNKVCTLDGIGSTDRNLNGNVPNKFSTAVEEAVKHEKVIGLTTTNKLHEDDILRPPTMARMILASDSDLAVSSSYLTLPTVLPKPQFQNHCNNFPLNNWVLAGGPMNNSGPKNNFYQQFAEFQPEQGFGNFSHISSGFLGQNYVQTTGFPIPLHQGMDYQSNMSSLTYSQNSFLNNIKVCPRINGSVIRLPGGEPSIVTTHVLKQQKQ